MIADTRHEDRLVGRVMRGFEFDNEEAVLAKDDASRRLFAYVLPEVRRDMIGWLGIAASEKRPSETWRDALLEYLAGAAQATYVAEPEPPTFIGSDIEAIKNDLMKSAFDMRTVNDTINELLRVRVDEPDSGVGSREIKSSGG